MLGPLLVSDAVALILILVALKWPRSARAVIGVGFVVAACFNVVTVLRAPRSHVEGFGPRAAVIYRRIIYGASAQDPRLFVLPMALGQPVVGPPVLNRSSRTVRVGLSGGIIFLLAMMPLGLGSAFPSPLVFAVAPALLMRSRV